MARCAPGVAIEAPLELCLSWSVGGRRYLAGARWEWPLRFTCEKTGAHVDIVSLDAIRSESDTRSAALFRPGCSEAYSSSDSSLTRCCAPRDHLGPRRTVRTRLSLVRQGCVVREVDHYLEASSCVLRCSWWWSPVNQDACFGASVVASVAWPLSRGRWAFSGLWRVGWCSVGRNLGTCVGRVYVNGRCCGYRTPMRGIVQVGAHF